MRALPRISVFTRMLGGTHVLFDRVPGVVLYASMNQVNPQAPFEIAGKAAVKATVDAAGYDVSDPIEMRAAALNQDYSDDTPAAPAGEVIQLFLTGQGLTNPRVKTGALAPTVAPLPQSVKRGQSSSTASARSCCFPGSLPAPSACCK